MSSPDKERVGAATLKSPERFMRISLGELSGNDLRDGPPILRAGGQVPVRLHRDEEGAMYRAPTRQTQTRPASEGEPYKSQGRLWEEARITLRFLEGCGVK